MKHRGTATERVVGNKNCGVGFGHVDTIKPHKFLEFIGLLAGFRPVFNIDFRWGVLGDSIRYIQGSLFASRPKLASRVGRGVGRGGWGDTS